MSKTIVLLGGRTGGPIIPLLAIAKNLPEYKTVIFDVNNSFGQKVAQSSDTEFVLYPEAKLKLLTYKVSNPVDLIKDTLDAIKSLILLIFSTVKALVFIVTKQPACIFSAGSFLAVPVLYATNIARNLRLAKTKIVIHQQDPQPGLSNRLTIRFADLKTHVFEHTATYNDFKDSRKIPNPFDFSTFSENTLNQTEQKTRTEKPELMRFIEKSKRTQKPLLLLFGGGSGSEFINSWFIEETRPLLARFNIIHLTGTHQEPITSTNTEEYLSYPYLVDDMKLVLYHSDLVISRCGLGTITELQNLSKPGYLIPLPDSHQELNAQEVRDEFIILEQRNKQKWIDIVNSTYPNWFTSRKHMTNPQSNQKLLEEYYASVRLILEK